MSTSGTAADLIKYPPPYEYEEGTRSIGMIVFLGSWAMMFAGLFFVYGAVRLRADVWPPVDQPALPIGLPTVNTLVLVLSSAAMELGLRAVRKGRAANLAPLLTLALFLAAAFIGLQAHLWSQMSAIGFTPKTGPYASVFFGLTGLHALHVAIGIVALAWVCFRAFRGAYTPPRHQTVGLWTMYWHFVGVVWLAMFVTIFLV